MPARPNDPTEFSDALRRVADALVGLGEPGLADRIFSAMNDMEAAGYTSGPPGAESRQRVRELLEGVGTDHAAAPVRQDLTYALGWLRRVDTFHRELSAKGHLTRRRTRDIR